MKNGSGGSASASCNPAKCQLRVRPSGRADVSAPGDRGKSMFFEEPLGGPVHVVDHDEDVIDPQRHRRLRVRRSLERAGQMRELKAIAGHNN